MNKKVLNKPTLIIMYGFPGSGKSFFSRQFVDEVNAALVNADHLRNEFFENPSFTKQEDSIVDHLCYYMVEEFLNNGLNVVLDANSFRIAQRRTWREIAVRLKAEIIVVWLQLDIESAFDRVVKRDRRKVDDKYSRPLDRTSFETVIQGMQNPQRHEDYIVISGKHTFGTQKNSVLKKLYEKNLISLDTANEKLIKPELVNLIPNPLAGRVDPARRNIVIR